MNWIEILLITLGISLDLFAAVECQGALVAKVKKRHLGLITLLLSAWQMFSLSFGYLCAHLLCRYDIRDNKILTGRILSVAILGCLGVRLLWKAWKNEQIDERREEDLGVKRFIKMAVTNCFYTVLAGTVLGFFGTGVALMLGIFVATTAICVVVGIYTGYHFGYEQKTKAYWLGGGLLLVAGIDVLIRYIL